MQNDVTLKNDVHYCHVIPSDASRKQKFSMNFVVEWKDGFHITEIWKG